MTDLTSQTFLITGAGTGLGAAIARTLATAGARCVLVGRRRDKLESVAAEIGSMAVVIPCDVTDEAQVTDLIAETVRLTGRLDGLVNSAGIFEIKPFAETDVSFFDRTLSANLRSVFLLCHAAWPHLIASRGQIINISSIAGVQGFPGSAAYCASKFGVNGLGEVLALEGKPHGIRVLTLCPAQTDTPIWEGQAPEAVRARMMPPEIVADFVRWAVTAPRTIELGPVLVRNFRNPWEG